MKKNTIFKLLVIILIFILCIGYTIKTFQNDTFYTITIGKDILRYGVDMKDHYSFHMLSYTYPHWLYDVFVYLIYNNFGLVGIYISNIIFYFFIGVLIFACNNSISKNAFVSAIISISSVIMLPDFITARAQVITYILFILEIWLIEKYLNSNKKKFLIGLPIISLLIANLHCAVWVFFFILFLPCIAERLLYLYKQKEIKIKKIHKPKGKFIPCKLKINLFKDKFWLDKTNIKLLVLTMFICILVGFITLNGTTPFTYIINTMRGTTTTWIGEHLPPTLYYHKNLIFLLIVLFIIGLLKTKIRMRDLFLIVGLFILAASSFRHISLLIICGSFVFVRIFSEWIDKNNSNITDLFINIFTKKIIFIVFVFLFSLVSFSNYFSKKINEQEYIDETIYPVSAANYIVENIDLKSMKLFNEYNYGSYLLFRGIPVFIDSRADLYTPQFSGLKRDITKDFLDATLNYEEIFEYYDITHVICYRYNEEFGSTVFYKILDLDSNYNLLYEDDYFAVFERNK